MQSNDSFSIRIVEYANFRSKPLVIYWGDIDNEKESGITDSFCNFRFYYSEPYLKCDGIFAGIMLNYCPFCGVNLYTFYVKKRDIKEYVNEIESVTF